MLSSSSSLNFNSTFGRSKKRQKQSDYPIDEFGQLASRGEQQFVLDTNLDDMEGIVDANLAQTSAPRGSLGCSTASDSIDLSDRDFAQPSSFTQSDLMSQSSGFYRTLDPHRAASPVFTDPFSLDRATRVPHNSSLNFANGPSKLSSITHLNPPHILLQHQGPSERAERLLHPEKSLPLLPPTGPSDGGSTLPSWFPPESWAVHEDNAFDYAASSDDSDPWEVTQEDGDGPTSFSTRGTLSNGKRNALGGRGGKDFGVGSTSSGIGQWKGKERSDDDGLFVGKPRSFSGPGSLMYALRVYRTDGKMYRVRLPLSASVQDLAENMHKRLGNEKRESHRLYLQERGRERLLAPTEQPAMIVKRRLEQAGYEVVDKLDELGAEDLSFLMKFVFKSVRLGGTEEDGANYENFEHLDLTGRSLQAIPAIVHAHASNIVSLNLSKNPLLEIPLDFIQSCESLREVRLSHMAMKKNTPIPTALFYSPTVGHLL